MIAPMVAPMPAGSPRAEDAPLTLRLATGEEDLRAAQRLRYDVFVAELGADGPTADHDTRLERDDFDRHFDHLVLIDPRRAPGEHVVGAYRLLPCDRLDRAGRFYSAAEFDLSPLLSSGRRLLELGRSCVHRDYRGGTAMFHLWNGLASYVLDRGIEVLFGAASFPGTDPAALAVPLSWLHHSHLAVPELRVRAIGAQAARMDLLPLSAVDPAEAMAAMPALIRAYLRLGGSVGEGCWVDRDFNTTDVCLVMDTGRMSERHRQFYRRKAGSAS